MSRSSVKIDRVEPEPLQQDNDHPPRATKDTAKVTKEQCHLLPKEMVSCCEATD